MMARQVPGFHTDSENTLRKHFMESCKRCGGISLPHGFFGMAIQK